jgi:subtilisin family serine protease
MKRTEMKTSTWFEFAALPLIAGFALGSGFILGGDDSRRMIETFSPKELAKTVPTPEPINKKELGSHPGRNVASRITAPWGLLTTDAQEAWRISEGSRKIVVAVIDTGADVDHPDLKDNIWINPGESGRDDLGRDKATNGIDDDGNGYVDDIHGWNFVFDNENVQDNHGHGTHIAGIIGATGSSKLTGVAPHVSMMILKYFDPRKPQQNPLEATIKAIHYAIKNGAQVINYSGGGLAPSAQEYAALQEAAAKGILVVAAAGNEHTNSDHNRYYPADYDLPNILSVTAMNPNAKVLTTSNFGPETVDIAAPGEDIFSTMPDGAYGTMTGTSQATAFATGVAVLVKSMHPEMTPEQIIDHLVATGEPTKSLTGKTRARSALNAYRALAIAGSDESVSGITHSADDDRFILNAR